MVSAAVMNPAFGRNALMVVHREDKSLQHESSPCDGAHSLRISREREHVVAVARVC